MSKVVESAEGMEWNILETTKGKVLLVGDLHLNAKEMVSTKKMVLNNMVMFESLYTYLENNTDINLVIFLGDIQHKTPSGKNSSREVYRWNKAFSKIGKLMKPRYFENNIKVITSYKVNDDGININKYGLEIPEAIDINEGIRNNELNPLFTLRGNHDIDVERVNGLTVSENSDLIPYTYYDSCISNGILINPDQLLINDELLINFYNYGEVEQVYPHYDTVKHTIGLYHDTIVTEDTPFWIRDSGGVYTPEVAIKHEDVVYIGHIHERYEPVFVETEGKIVPIVVVGSMGRTSTNEGQIRDMGYCHEINLNELNATNSVELPVIPVSEYFNLREKIARRETADTLREFSLSMGDDVRDVAEFTDVRSLVNTLDIEPDIKATCISLLDEVMEA